jgi:hypothetical protein
MMPLFRGNAAVIKAVIKSMKRVATVLAVAIAGLVVAAFVILSADYSRAHSTPSHNAIAVTAFTALTFYAIASEFRRDWRRWSFWFAWSALLVAHLALFVLSLRKFATWPIVVLVVIAIPETTCLCMLLDKWGFTPGGYMRRGGKHPDE